MHVTPDLRLSAVPHRLVRALLHVLTNAHQAMAGGGALAIEASHGPGGVRLVVRFG